MADETRTSATYGLALTRDDDAVAAVTTAYALTLSGLPQESEVTALYALVLYVPSHILYLEGRPTGGESLCEQWRIHTWLEWNI